ncbi:MAG: hypothetical protein ABR589_13315, partial [Chthoniobacterales bacterium]
MRRQIAQFGYPAVAGQTGGIPAHVSYSSVIRMLVERSNRREEDLWFCQANASSQQDRICGGGFDVRVAAHLEELD